MGLIESGIDNVRAFELPAGIWTDGSYMSQPRAAVVKWRSSWNDKFYQVYVNGHYAGATVDAGQRQMVVAVPSSLKTAVRIEVFAVDAEDAQNDLSADVDGLGGLDGRVRFMFLRSQVLPFEGRIEIYSDNGTGQIDYSRSLCGSAFRIWPKWQDKAGFGLGRFGSGDFGFDGGCSVGFGKGRFGEGQFGFDADTIEWVSEQLEAGVYKFAVRVIDEMGNQSVAAETEEIFVNTAARPAGQISVFSFDKQTNQLVLSVT
jgi:hypothetical protein